MSFEFFRDEAGDPRARVMNRQTAALGQFLESDVQGSAAFGLEILAAIEAVAAGRVREWTRTGNLYTLTISCGRVTIEPDFDEEIDSGEVSVEELEEAVISWIQFLDGGNIH